MQRKQYSPELKEKIILEAIEVGSPTLVARKYEINANMLGRWVRKYKEGKKTSSIPEEHSVSVSEITMENRQLSQENEQLKKLLGEKDLEIAILRDLIKKKNPHLLTKLK
ncbi:transposase [Paenibacillus validus]|uniref:transposase n=1 Tax=Paenibacillus TaxID=44249 RepID=UPI000FDCCAA7|nr:MULTISPECIES: transposase [Paenibacillus]MED4600045.1 transposase [Paenibacillus validus]MED4605688.1 transposase [Paenibacillus validus]NTZ18693.1 transposase [Paenibacillus sp. JMULE4]